MPYRSILENPTRLSALLREKAAYNRYMSPNRSVLDCYFEDVSRERRIGILKARFEGYEKSLVSSLMDLVTAEKITIDKAAECADMAPETFRKISQEIISEKLHTKTNNNDSESENHKPRSDSELKLIIMRHIDRGYSIPAIAGYTSKTVDQVEGITGLRSKVSQLEYDIINDLLEFRYDVKKEVLIAAITNLIYEGVLSVSEAADRMKMTPDEFLKESGLIEKCSFDGKLMIKTNMDTLINKCMNSLTANLHTTDIELFNYIIIKGLYDITEWLDNYIDKTSNEATTAYYDNSYDDDLIEGFDIYKAIRDISNNGLERERLLKYQISTARSLLANGVSDDIIINCTAISPDELEILKTEAEKN